MIGTTPGEEASRQANILSSAGQRRVNIIWEVSQALIAYAVIGGTLYADVSIALSRTEISPTQMAALMQLNTLAGIVVGFYFGKSNHVRTGGVGGSDVREAR